MQFLNCVLRPKRAAMQGPDWQLGRAVGGDMRIAINAATPFHKVQQAG